MAESSPPRVLSAGAELDPSIEESPKTTGRVPDKSVIPEPYSIWYYDLETAANVLALGTHLKRSNFKTAKSDKGLLNGGF